MSDIKLNFSDKSINPVDESTTENGSFHNPTAKTGTVKYENLATKSTHHTSIIDVHNSTKNVTETEGQEENCSKYEVVLAPSGVTRHPFR